MNIRRWVFNPLGTAGAFALLFSIAYGSTDDRRYLLGDDGAEGASNGAAVMTTFDSAGALGMNQLHDLEAEGSPVYRTITGRPDGGSGLGIEFNGTSQYLTGARLGLPDTTASAINGAFAGTLNYNGLVNRGLQFWVQPGATGAQTLVMDTNQHGARINADGNFSMRYAGDDFDSGVAVTVNTWYHILVVRPDGPANGSRMFIDGIAVVAAPGGYDGADTSNLVVGSNTGGDNGLGEGEGFTGGTEEFFDGIIDDLSLFVIGDNSSDTGPPPGQNYGAFNLGTDNDFAVSVLSGVAGDVDNDGDLDQDDKDDFIAGWMSENLVNDLRVGDLNSIRNGDLNFDGITDINDLVMMQAALPLAGLSRITAAELNGIPEPSTCVVLLIGSICALATRRQR